jgi:membrane protein implicated in regulation of membrane protease activity
MRMVCGLPAAWSAMACLCVAAAMVVAVLALRRDAFAWLCAGAFLAIPALLYALSIPNTVFGRYFLVPTLFLLLALAQAFGEAVRHGGGARNFAGAALAGLLAFQVAGTADFLVLGRGRYGEAVALMGRDGGEATYGSDRAARAQRIVSYFAPRQGVAARLVPEEAWCTRPPRWMIRDARTLPDTLTVCPDQPRAYRLAARWPSWRYSGAPWSLYLLDDRTSGEAHAPGSKRLETLEGLGLRPVL